MTLYELLKVFPLYTEVKLYNISGVVLYEGALGKVPSEYILVYYLVDGAYVSEHGVLKIIIEQGEGEK